MAKKIFLFQFVSIPFCSKCFFSSFFLHEAGCFFCSLSLSLCFGRRKCVCGEAFASSLARIVFASGPQQVLSTLKHIHFSVRVRETIIAFKLNLAQKKRRRENSLFFLSLFLVKTNKMIALPPPPQSHFFCVQPQQLSPSVLAKGAK